MHSLHTWTGIVGVGLLLAAFILNIAHRLTEDSKTYLLLNLVGAGLAAWYAWTLRLYPFLTLETVWAGFAFYRLLIKQKKRLPV